MTKKISPILFAVSASAFYAVNIPLSKLLMNDVAPTMMAGLLYLGAGIGVVIMFSFGLKLKKIKKEELLSGRDFPYVLGMIALDTVAPILLMFGIRGTTSGNAALLNNFEIVATSIIALIIFKESISKKLWIAIVLVTISSSLLTFDVSSLSLPGKVFSYWEPHYVGALKITSQENYRRRARMKS